MIHLFNSISKQPSLRSVHELRRGKKGYVHLIICHVKEEWLGLVHSLFYEVVGLAGVSRNKGLQIHWLLDDFFITKKGNCSTL
jgi:hypothetical protein